MTESAAAAPYEIIQTYYDSLTGGAAALEPDRLRAILSPDLVFEGPVGGRRVGAEGFIRGVLGFIDTARRLTMIHTLFAANAAAALYDAEMPGGVVRFAEFFELADGRTHSLRLLYDASEYQARGGR
ncbi:MAG: nuclear transport factor 2 family protein [Clostridia bacterium]